MKENVFYGKGIGSIKSDYPELFNAITVLNEAVFTGKALDYKTQKLIAVAIAVSNSDDRAIEKQFKSAIKEVGATKDELLDVLRVVLLTSGMPPFMKAVSILNKAFE
ncbi:carboxymuconolactone decarboxylase family protein [Methanobrevibacter filiformis]|uniref:Carboxymuconolactone decarboxylase family protein n=1 Tax=Methanobrevibacter filiformis TaxID=55758 RepID=A0A165ZQX0_9EURY|nr:carboxymuconolactone decarboxylase family protein [Methanobrevibacter filiformis]KZX11049.1 carboxymuconolactone decarboxylase family protein [Methanobrevibacter filiformis]